MVYLAQFQPGSPVPVSEIASTQQIPKKFLDAILSELRNAGFVNSKMGKGGGYTLARTASQIKRWRNDPSDRRPLGASALREQDALPALRRLPGRDKMRRPTGHAGRATRALAGARRLLPGANGRYGGCRSR